MFLHLGNGFSVPLEKVISMHDFESLRRMKKDSPFFGFDEEKISDISHGRQRTVVVTSEKVYISAISASTLKKRAEDFLRRTRCMGMA